MIVKISIPLTNYENTDTFDFDIYFEGDRPPTLEDVIYRCNHEHEEELKLFDVYPERGPYSFEYGQCLEILRDFPEEFPNLEECYRVSIPIPTKFGNRAISAEIIRPFPLEKIEVSTISTFPKLPESEWTGPWNPKAGGTE